jgi:hypothetical protein
MTTKQAIEHVLKARRRPMRRVQTDYGPRLLGDGSGRGKRVAPSNNRAACPLDRLPLRDFREQAIHACA